MSREFTRKEKILLLVCTAMMLGIFYYQVVWKSTSQIMETYNVETLEEELLLAQAKATKMLEMENFLEEYKGQARGIVADYNNLQNEITELNGILADAYTYKLDFEDATTDGSIVRRNVHITFQTGDYHTAKNIIQALKDSRYKSLVRDINILAKEKSLQTTDLVDVSLKVTFYEGVTEAVAIAGLPEYTDGGKTKE